MAFKGKEVAVKLSVIIPTCGRPTALAECLKRVTPGAQTLDAAHYEVIVTDDGSAGNEVAALVAEHFPWCHWVRGPRRGPAVNRNRGAAPATGEVLVFFDDDCLPEPGVLAAYAEHFADPHAAGAVEGRISADRAPRRLDEVAPVNETGGLFWSCNIAIRAEVFRRLGGFDERFPHAAMEDVELRQRLRRAGETIVFLPEAGVVHPLRRMGDWAALRRNVAAQGIYARLTTSHQRSLTWRHATWLVGRTWVKSVLPGLWRHRGRGFSRRAMWSISPWLAAAEIRKARCLPELKPRTASNSEKR